MLRSLVGSEMCIRDRSKQRLAIPEHTVVDDVIEKLRAIDATQWQQRVANSFSSLDIPSLERLLTSGMDLKKFPSDMEKWKALTGFDNKVAIGRNFDPMSGNIQNFVNYCLFIHIEDKF